MRTKNRHVFGSLLFGLIALAASAGFVRLGVWQLGRHAEVSAVNQARSEVMEMDPIRLDAAALDSLSVEQLIGRRVEVSGTWDFGREVIIRSRAHAGSPGTHVVTPLTLDGVSEAGEQPATVLVLRGWLPSSSAALPRSATHGVALLGRESPRTALVEPSRAGLGAPAIELGEGEHAVLSYAALDVDLIAGSDSDVLPFFLQLLPREDGSVRDAEPLPVSPPTLGNGSHMGYAIQWFSFALITIVGTIAFLRRRTQAEP